MKKTPFLILGAVFWTAAVMAAPEAIEIHPGNAGGLPKGREADGIIGDFVLRNDKIEAVISRKAPHRRANMSTFYGDGGETPGCLYDLTLRGENNDQLTIWTPCNQRGEVSWVRILDGEPAVETFTSAALGGGVSKRHIYRVEDGVQGVFVDTTLHNESDAPKEIEVRDIWTRFEKHGMAGRYRWADSVDPADRCGYAFAWLEPDELTEQSGKVMLEPGRKLEIKRLITVDRSPAAALGRLAEHLESPEIFSLTVQDPDGNPVNDAQGTIEFRDARIPFYADREGRVSFPFPPGSYVTTVTAPGRPHLKQTIKVSENPGEPVVTLDRPSVIAFDITDKNGESLPCKVQFHGIDGTQRPHLGPTIRAHGCADQWHSETGQFEVPIAAGSYRVIVTRGPEYSHLEKEVTSAYGQTVTVKGQLERLVDTTGWVSADFHNHSTPSGDNVCGTDDRIINLAAEHLEFAPTTEHNRIYDWTPHIESLGLAAFISTIPGIELTGRGAHINSFPLTPVPRTQDGGAPVWEDDPRVNILHLQNLGGFNPARWTQINHPDLTENFFDRNGDGKLDGGFFQLSGFVNGVETQNYRTSHILANQPFFLSNPLQKGSRITQVREFIWLQMLNQGHKIWAVAVADAHTVYGNGTGSWRVYLPSSTDKPAELKWEKLVDHARAGHMYVSSGPFLQVKLDGREVLPGDEVYDTSGDVKLSMNVQCSDWLDIDRVQVLVNGKQEPALNFTRKSHPGLFRDGVVRFQHDVSVELEEDTHLIVVAMGENSDLGKGFGTSPQSNVKPCAYNNPIFIDVDGGGFQANGDTLGYPLPAGGLSVDEVKNILENN